MLKRTFPWVAVMITLAASTATAQETAGGTVPVSTEIAIKRLGLEARVQPEQRDAAVQRLAASIVTLNKADKDQLKALQKDFQQALLLVCDPDIYATLSDTAIHAVDDALKQVFTLDDLARDGTWEPLAYVYGYFNRGITAADIKAVWEKWDAMTEAEREPLYPTYPHLIEAVCKPLTMGPLFDAQATGPALSAAVPMLGSMVMQKPAPGRAYHLPSHAALILGPLYQRWAEDPTCAVYVRTWFPDRERLESLIAGQLVGSLPDLSQLEPFAYEYYAYTGRYMANALARLDARIALPALQESLDIYRKHAAPEATIAYTRRALVALGDGSERASLEQDLKGPGAGRAVGTLVWLCRNCQGESRDYAADLLGKYLDVPPQKALDEWFSRELAALPPE